MGSIWYWLLLALSAVPYLLGLWSIWKYPTRASATTDTRTNDGEEQEVHENDRM